MMGAIQAWPGQVIHGCIHNDEILYLALLGIKDPAYENSRITDYYPPGLQDQGALQSRHLLFQGPGILLGMRRFFILVADAKPTAQVQVVY